MRRLYWARWATQVAAGGLDPDDVYQQVWVALLSPRRAPYNPARGGLSTWLYLVIRGVVYNALDQAARSAPRWQLGLAHDVAQEEEV